MSKTPSTILTEECVQFCTHLKNKYSLFFKGTQVTIRPFHALDRRRLTYRLRFLLENIFIQHLNAQSLQLCPRVIICAHKTSKKVQMKWFFKREEAWKGDLRAKRCLRVFFNYLLKLRSFWREHLDYITDEVCFKTLYDKNFLTVEKQWTWVKEVYSLFLGWVTGSSDQKTQLFTTHRES